MSKKRNQNFIQGAAILAATVAILKLMGAIYKIPLGNILGDEGFAHFSVAYNIYSLLLTLSTAGMPIALSRMIAAYDAEGRTMQVKRTFSVALTSFFVLGLIATLIMLLLPRQLASALNDTAAAASIAALAPSVLFVCLMSAYRGYSQGLSDMIPTSVSQIIEVGGKLVFGLALAWWFLNRGMGLPTASAGAIAGVSVGSLLALLYCASYKRSLDRDGMVNRRTVGDKPISRKATLAKLVSIGIPVALGSSVLSILAIFDTSIILGRLQSSAGYTQEQAAALYGVFMKVHTVFNLPSNFIVPITISIIPAISASITRRKYAEANRVTETSVKLTNLLAMPAGAGLTILSYPIVNVLYPDSSTEGPELLAILGIASFFVCLTLLTNALLQAYGYERFPVYTMTIGGIIKVALTWLLVSNPDIGVRGAALSTLACYAIISVVNIAFIRFKLPERPKLIRNFVKPFAATLVMGGGAYFANLVFSRILSGIGNLSDKMVMAVSMSCAILFAALLYLVMIIILRAITKDDLAMIPKGGKIAKILRIS